MSAPVDAWYAGASGKVHEKLSARALQTRANMRTYRDGALHLMRMRIGSRDLTGEELASSADNRLRFNVVSMALDTLGSVVAGARPLPMIVSKAGDWSLQRKAKLRTRVLQTQAMEIGLYQAAAQAFDDAATTGLGFVYFFQDPDTGLPTCERVPQLEMSWDWVEALNGRPRSLFRTRLVDREVLKSLYPSKAAQIAAARGPSEKEMSEFIYNRFAVSCDQVMIFEAWHLPSSTKAKDGRHAICTDNVTLSDEPLKRARFPFGIFRYAPRSLGFLGRSAADECRPAQARIHALLEHVEKCQNLGSVPRVYLPRGATVQADELNNEPMSIIYYDGLTPPVFQAFDATPHDLQEEIDRIVAQLLTQLGLNQSQVAGEKPAGVTSAIGMQTLEDIGSRRHAQNLKMFEASMLQCFEALSDVNDDVAEEDPSFELRVDARGKFLETSKWGELAIDSGDMRVSVFPISSLPTTPGGRFDRIEELINRGWISQQVAVQLLGLPDTEAHEDITTAQLRLVQRQISMILDGKTDPVANPEILPDKYQDLAYAKEYALNSLAQAREEDAPDEILDMLRDYLAHVKRLEDAAMASGAIPAQQAPVQPQQQMPEALPNEQTMGGMA